MSAFPVVHGASAAVSSSRARCAVVAVHSNRSPSTAFPSAMTGSPPPKHAPAAQPAPPTGVSAVADSWEASALASSLEHVVENVGLHFLGGGKEYPARELRNQPAN